MYWNLIKLSSLGLNIILAKQWHKNEGYEKKSKGFLGVYS